MVGEMLGGLPLGIQGGLGLLGRGLSWSSCHFLLAFSSSILLVVGFVALELAIESSAFFCASPSGISSVLWGLLAL